MFVWNVYEGRLVSEKDAFYEKHNWETNCALLVFDTETKVSREDKIGFVDYMHDGGLSYILSLLKKYQEEKPDDFSLRKWLQRNDKKKVFKMDDLGLVNFLNVKRHIQKQLMDAGKRDAHEDYVDECFRHMLISLMWDEEKYQKKHNAYRMKEIHLAKLLTAYPGLALGVPIIIKDVNHLYLEPPLFSKGRGTNRWKKPSMEVIDKQIAKFEILQKFVEKESVQSQMS